MVETLNNFEFHHLLPLESNTRSSTTLSCSAFNFAFVASGPIFLSKLEFYINPEISDLSNNSFSFIFGIKYFTPKFTIIRYGSIFTLNIWYFFIIIFFFIRSLTFCFLFSTVLKAVVVAKSIILCYLKYVTYYLTLNISDRSIIICFFNKSISISYFLVSVINFLL